MLAKKYRLKSAKDIQNVFRRGKSTRSGFLFLKYHPNGLSVSRIAFSIGLKYSKKAVERNRAKRLLARETKNRIDRLASGFDVVVYLGKISPHELARPAVEHNLEKALVKTNLLKQ